MKTVEKFAAQGDVLFVRVDRVPEGSTREVSGPAAVVAHSETGHHHVAKSAAEGFPIYLFGTTDPMVKYLKIGAAGADVVHERPWDTHETLHLGEGAWQVRRQREADPVRESRVVAD